MELLHMSKMSLLQAQLEKATGKAAPETTVNVPGEKKTEKRSKAPSREGRVHIGAYLPSDFKRSLRLVQAETGEDTQTLIARALNDVFRAHKVPIVDPE